MNGVPILVTEQPADRTGTEYGECPVCHRTVALWIPRKGDGSMVVLRNHGPRSGKCAGSRHEPARVIPSGATG